MEDAVNDTLPDLTRDEMIRYSRHLILPEVGLEGQRRLKGARVAIVGMGGLGSPAGMYLAAAGIGTLGLVDDDEVEVSNLQRQVIHGTGALGRSKVDSARDRILDLNPDVQVEIHRTRLGPDNAMEILGEYDLVVDGTDNFPTRYLVNDACVLLGRPYVYGSVLRFDGQMSLFAAPGGPCYRCLFREPPPPDLVPSCSQGGILGVLPGIIGSLQALETIKWILGRDESGAGDLLLFDGLEMTFRTLQIRRDPSCPVCGDEPTVRELIDYEEFCGVTGEPDAFPVPEISPLELKARLDAGDPITLIDVRMPQEWEFTNLGAYGARLVPLARLGDVVEELRNTNHPIVVYCRYGGRSRRAVRDLQEAGVTGVQDLAGGMMRWQEEVDPSIIRY